MIFTKLNKIPATTVASIYYGSLLAVSSALISLEANRKTKKNSTSNPAPPSSTVIFSGSKNPDQTPVSASAFSEAKNTRELITFDALPENF